MPLSDPAPLRGRGGSSDAISLQFLYPPGPIDECRETSAPASLKIRARWRAFSGRATGSSPPGAHEHEQDGSQFQIELSSEFIPSPKLRVVDLAARRGLFEKIAGEKDSIVSLKPGVTIDLPSHLHPRPVADEPCAAVSGWDEQKPRDSIHA